MKYVVLCLFLISSPVLGFDALDCRVVMDGELSRQFKTPFDEKFKIINEGKSLEDVSQHNLNSVRAAYNNVAVATEDWSSDFEIVHQVWGVPTLLKILNDGYLYSLDEQIRRGLAPFSSKLRSRTRAEIDGKVGEQDTVFLRIFEKGDEFESNIFGNVQLSFQWKTIEKGYFTFYPLGFGSLQTSIHDPEFLEKAIPLYRTQIFQGSRAFNTLVSLMKLQETLTQAALKSAGVTSQDLYRHRALCDTEAGVTNEICGISFFEPILKSAGVKIPQYAMTTQIPKTLPGSWRGWDPFFTRRFLWGDPQTGFFRRTLEQYRFIPTQTNEQSFIYTNYYGFWEHKVPVKLETALISEVSIQKKIAPFPDQGQLSLLRSALDALARKTNRVVIRDEDENKIMFRFIEIPSRSTNRRHF